MTASLKAGAVIALPRATPASILTRVITRLLAKPAKPKPAKLLRPQAHQTSRNTRH